VAEDINKLIWRETVLANGKGGDLREMLHRINEQMEMLNSVACVPSYYRHKLMAVLLLGEKKDGHKFAQDELDFFAAVASDAAMAIRNAQLFTRLKSQSERNRQLFLRTINVLGSTIEAKDSYTHGHTERVTDFSMAIARQMVENGSARLSKSFFENLYIASLLHDIGKIAVPESILNKPGRLTGQEYAVIKKHTIKGDEMVRPLALPRECRDGILYHHEWYDGKGYPEGLKGEDIPVSASIIAVADAYDAMTSDRPYRKGLDKFIAIEEIRKYFGVQFNPLPARALLELFEKGEA
jgi:HD-GYP domain-containing protein (c-di-GMP phosphodiesterase class II)